MQITAAFAFERLWKEIKKLSYLWTSEQIVITLYLYRLVVVLMVIMIIALLQWPPVFTARSCPLSWLIYNSLVDSALYFPASKIIPEPSFLRAKLSVLIACSHLHILLTFALVPHFYLGAHITMWVSSCSSVPYRIMEHPRYTSLVPTLAWEQAFCVWFIAFQSQVYQCKFWNVLNVVHTVGSGMSTDHLLSARYNEMDDKKGFPILVITFPHFH